MNINWIRIILSELFIFQIPFWAIITVVLKSSLPTIDTSDEDSEIGEKYYLTKKATKETSKAEKWLITVLHMKEKG